MNGVDERGGKRAIRMSNDPQARQTRSGHTDRTRSKSAYRSIIYLECGLYGKSGVVNTYLTTGGCDGMCMFYTPLKELCVGGLVQTACNRERERKKKGEVREEKGRERDRNDGIVGIKKSDRHKRLYREEQAQWLRRAASVTDPDLFLTNPAFVVL